MPKVSKVGKFRAKAASSAVRPATPPTTRPFSAHKSNSSRLENDNSEAPHSPSDATGDKTMPATSFSPAVAAAATTLSRGQRKRLAKKEQYLRRNRMVMSTLRLKREEEQRGKIDGLEEIREALRPIAKGGDSGAKSSRKGKDAAEEKKTLAMKSLGTNRAKKDLVGKETSHMGLVLEHPAFASDPFGAIRTHLQNSLAGQAEEQRVTNEARRKEEEREEKKKKEAKKEKLRAVRVGTKMKRPVRAGSTGKGRRNRI